MGTSAEYKVELRAVLSQDLPLILAWRSDQEIMQYLPSASKRPTWKEHLEYWAKAYHRDWIIMLDAYRPVGIVHIIPGTGEMGIIVGEKTIWGKGIATQALALVLALIKKNAITKEPIWAAIHPGNTGSQKAFAKVGFVNTHELGRNDQERWVLK